MEMQIINNYYKKQDLYDIAILCLQVGGLGNIYIYVKNVNTNIEEFEE